VWRWLAALLVVAAAAEAEPPGRRLLAEEEAAAFRGVGRLNIAGRRFCTATLIEPAVIVTAAHCLFHPRTLERVPLSEFRFVAGLHRGEVAAVRRAVRVAASPDFAFDGIADNAGVRADLALIELDAPVTAEAAAPFAPARLAAGAAGGPLAIVSYARDRPHAPSIETPCVAVSVFGPVMALDCAVDYGASGGPVLQGEGPAARLVAVVSAIGRVLASEAEVTLAVLAEPEVARLRAELAVAPFEGEAGVRPRPRPEREGLR
jgi:protease YdgD